MSSQAVRTVAVLLFEGVELMDFAGPAEVFIVAAEGRNFCAGAQRGRARCARASLSHVTAWRFQVVCGPGRVWRALTLSGLTTELHFLSRVPDGD